MDKALLAFIFTVVAVIIVCTVIAIVKQVRINRTSKNSTVVGSYNHRMKTKNYSGKYSICGKIGEADAEF